jgi:hypothetical protein
VFGFFGRGEFRSLGLSHWPLCVFCVFSLGGVGLKVFRVWGLGFRVVVAWGFAV